MQTGISEGVIGHTTGENDCKKPIKALIYPFEVSVNFCGQDFADGIINVHSLSIKADKELNEGAYLID